MPDRIYDFQQVLIIQYIEDLPHILVQPARSRRQIHELWRTVWKMTVSDARCPARLKPEAFFSAGSGMHWEDRVMVDDMRVWLVELHKHYDEVGNRNAAR